MFVFFFYVRIPVKYYDESMSENVKIRLAGERKNPVLTFGGGRAPSRVFTPGEKITDESGFMRGHGTYLSGTNLNASVAGVQETVNRLITVRPIKSRYAGDVGDVVVGRITEVQQKRWKVDVNARLDATLLLSSVNLPGGELRRRSTEDEQMMRKYLQEGDLISAEVQCVFTDGTLSLHTRTLKSGKLSQGILVKVPPSLINQQKTHFHNLMFNVSVILGKNGLIWVYPTGQVDDEGAGGFTQNLEEAVDSEIRKNIARVKNCIVALSNSKMFISDTTIQFAFEESLPYEVKNILTPDVMLEIMNLTRKRILDLRDT